MQNQTPAAKTLAEAITAMHQSLVSAGLIVPVEIPEPTWYEIATRKISAAVFALIYFPVHLIALIILSVFTAVWFAVENAYQIAKQ